MKHEEMNVWEKKEGMYHRGVICCDHEWGLCGFAGIEAWWPSDPLDPIKPKAAGVVWVNSSLVFPFSTICYVSRQ